MKAAHAWLGALLVCLAGGSIASAQYQPPYYYPGYKPYPPCPVYDVCQPPVQYVTDRAGNVYPTWQVRPPFQPFNGLLLTQDDGGNANRGPAGLPQHPYARSPRDFFMYFDR